MSEPLHDFAAYVIAATDALRQEFGFAVTCGPSRAAIMVAERIEDRDDARVIALVVLSLWQRRAFELHPEAFKDRPDV